MAVLSKEDFLSRITSQLGEDSSDEALAFMEDMSDTYSDLETRASDQTDWKAKYEENDKAWRDRYRERFTAPVDEGIDTNLGREEDKPTPKTFDDLFTKEG